MSGWHGKASFFTWRMCQHLPSQNETRHSKISHFMFILSCNNSLGNVRQTLSIKKNPVFIYLYVYVYLYIDVYMYICVCVWYMVIHVCNMHVSVCICTYIYTCVLFYFTQTITICFKISREQQFFPQCFNLVTIFTCHFYDLDVFHVQLMTLCHGGGWRD